MAIVTYIYQSCIHASNALCEKYSYSSRVRGRRCSHPCTLIHWRGTITRVCDNSCHQQKHWRDYDPLHCSPNASWKHLRRHTENKLQQKMCLQLGFCEVTLHPPSLPSSFSQMSLVNCFIRQWLHRHVIHPYMIMSHPWRPHSRLARIYEQNPANYERRHAQPQKPSPNNSHGEHSTSHRQTRSLKKAITLPHGRNPSQSAAMPFDLKKLRWMAR